MPDHLAHWNDVEPSTRELEDIAGRWRDLGRAAGSVGIGVKHIQIPPGKRPTPVHRHTAEEETFYVAGGSGLSWQDGEVYEIGPGDCLVHLAGGPAHTLRGGAQGLEVFAFGPRLDPEMGQLPRAGIGWAPPSWVEIGKGPHPWEREVAAGPLEWPKPSHHPPTIARTAEVPANERGQGRARFFERRLSDAAGAQRTGLNHVEIAPGCEGWPPHCHSADEELFIVLGGAGTVLLGDEEHAIGPGHVIARPPGTGIPHQLRAAGDEPLIYLAYGTRVPDDVSWKPRSQTVHFRGLGVMGRIEPLDPWDGEGM